MKRTTRLQKKPSGNPNKNKRGFKEGSLRLDQYLVSKGLCNSRQKAQELILEGGVWVAERVLNKPSLEIKGALLSDLEQNLNLSKRMFVSRAGKKLWAYLEQNPLDCTNKVILDVGSSSGGFTQVLLEKGAQRVVCVDVGSNQLDPALREHPQIELHEHCDIRCFQTQETYDLITCDVSFISLSLILKSLIPLSRAYLLLFKPQFEVGRQAKRNKKGVVLSAETIAQRLKAFIGEAQALGLRMQHMQLSPIKGKEGNAETFIHFTR